MLQLALDGGYSSVAERRSVAADVVGSKPTSRPNLPLLNLSVARTPQPRAALKLFAGTSGWAYPTWKPGFYPPKTSAAKFLPFYASQLTSVEVNYTFRTLPTPEQLAGWLDAAPSGFRFSFKAPQRITHFARLRDCEAPVHEFVSSLAPVIEAGKLGLLFFQFPPNFKAIDETRARLAALLTLPALTGRQLAFEFRHDTWFTEETYELFRQHNAALCIASSEDITTPEVHTAATHTAFRLRRPGGYTPRELKAYATRLRALAADRDVYVYFKHEDEPTGPLNAVSFLAAADHS